MEKIFEILNFSDKGLIPAIIMDAESRTVLTLCYMNRDALEKTLETGKVYLFRRSKGRLMIKGETSGHIQLVRDVRVDCAGNSLLILVDQQVAACHLGYFSCYFRSYNADKGDWESVEERVFDPADVY
ncbi:MAG: phosphoribosyl-AMP cyclohydrolase [Planctomycetes bacterium]|nr:phosphoribosyl-AMP cyclohydrolase [Planctomycetota bacterium]